MDRVALNPPSYPYLPLTEVLTNYMPSPRPRNLGRVDGGLVFFKLMAGAPPPHHMNSE